MLKNIWDLQPNLSDIEGAAYPFIESVRSVNSTEKQTGLILGMFRYLFQGGIKGVDKALVEEFQKRGCIKGIIPEGGFMGPIELLKEEGRQEGRQEEKEKLVLQMLKTEVRSEPSHGGSRIYLCVSLYGKRFIYPTLVRMKAGSK